jgi:hypothetical protein
MGMMAQPTFDYQPDGTAQLVWAIRANVMDWPSSKSPVPLATMTNATFRITYDLVPDITAFNANLEGSSVLVQSLSDTNGTVVVYVPASTTDEQIAALAPIYTLDFGATCNQTNNAIPVPALSTGAPVNYIVSPSAGGGQPAKVYSVSVVRTAFTYAPWTGDADSGITNTSPYTVAVNLAGSAVTVNGVTFEAQPQDYPWSGANYTIEGSTSGFGGASPNLTGNSLTLGGDFLYDNPPCTVTLRNLTPGKTYETTFFSYGFDASGRTEVFASANETCVIDQDAYGSGNGIRILYRFIAGSDTKVITITPAAGSVGTFHFCALSNREVILPLDLTPPNPDPMSFAVPPAGLSVTSIVMTATTASDAASSPVSYCFENTNTSVNSGWISGTVWTNTGLTPGQTYGFRVKARDALTNTTAWSAVATAKPLDLVLYAMSSSSSNLTFTWSEEGFKLQMRTNLTVGDWVDYQGGNVSPISVHYEYPSCFFRLLQR